MTDLNKLGSQIVLLISEKSDSHWRTMVKWQSVVHDGQAV